MSSLTSYMCVNCKHIGRLVLMYLYQTVIQQWHKQHMQHHNKHGKTQTYAYYKTVESSTISWYTLHDLTSSECKGQISQHLQNHLHWQRTIHLHLAQHNSVHTLWSEYISSMLLKPLETVVFMTMQSMFMAHSLSTVSNISSRFSNNSESFDWKLLSWRKVSLLLHA